MGPEFFINCSSTDTSINKQGYQDKISTADGLGEDEGNLPSYIYSFILRRHLSTDDARLCHKLLFKWYIYQMNNNRQGHQDKMSTAAGVWKDEGNLPRFTVSPCGVLHPWMRPEFFTNCSSTDTSINKDKRSTAAGVGKMRATYPG